LFLRRIASALSLTLAVLVWTRVAANAEGVTRVQQSDGTVQTYDRVTIRLAGETLWLRSPDRRGVLEVTSGACSFVGQLQRCLPFRTTLHQHGTTHQIALERGAVYLNLTAGSHRLPHSSQHLGPHAVLVLLHTEHGTYVSVKGALDSVK
jgi:hypothetical protein